MSYGGADCTSTRRRICVSSSVRMAGAIDLCTSSAMPAVATPRSLDLAHLRTALWFHAEAPLERFITLDTAQGQAARDLGLPV